MAVEVTQKNIDLIVKNKSLKDDEILGLLIQDGVPFSKAKGILNTVLIEQGLRLTKEQKEEKVDEIMSGFEISADTTAEEVADQATSISDEIECSIKVARGHVKRYFDEADVEMPRASGGGGKRGPRAPGFGGDAKIASEWLIDNPEGTVDEFRSHMEDLGKDKTNKGADKVQGWFNFIGDLKIFIEKYNA